MSTRIDLSIRQTLDLEAIDRGHRLFLSRCFARVQFNQREGWGAEYFAIVDTGAPFSVLPKSIWRSPLTYHSIYPSHLRGLIPEDFAALPAQLVNLNCVLIDEKSISPELNLFALLVDSPDVPLILGWSGCLDQAKFVLDSPHKSAWLEV